MDNSQAAKNLFYSLAAYKVVHGLALLTSPESLREMQTLRQYPSFMGSESAFLKRFLLYLSLEKREEREKERKRNIDVREKHRLVAPCIHPDRGWNPRPRCVPDWELDWQPITLQDDTQPTEPHQPGPESAFLTRFPSDSYEHKTQNH